MIKYGKRYYLYMGWAAELCECDKIENYKKEIEENSYICTVSITKLTICLYANFFPNEGVFVVAMLSAFVIVSY